MSSHPEFICVGAAKAGTRWLYDQARSHPRVWMPPIKELRCINRGFQYLQGKAERKLIALQRVRERRGRQVDERDLKFLQIASSLKGGKKALSIERYVQLFEPAGDLVTGDISPGYAILDERRISLLAEKLPNCRFIFLLRDPIGRLWSHVNMQVRRGNASEDALTHLDELKKSFQRPGFAKHSLQSESIRRWRDIIGDERFRVFVMDDLVSDPVAYRRAVFNHIGLDADACTIEAGFNEKASKSKERMPETHRGFLLDYFGHEYEELRQLVTGPKPAWLVSGGATGGRAHDREP
jgi:hypothetical protein